MTKPRIYVSGPMTGMPGLNKPAFDQAAATLSRAGFAAINPAQNGVPDTAPWQEHMRVDIAMLTGCDGVATLPGHIASKGARLEVHIARQLGMPVMTVAQWLQQQREEAEVAA
jgi:nucleoside 2-deoxyribosyltransferase